MNVRYCNAQTALGFRCQQTRFRENGRCVSGHIPGSATTKKPVVAHSNLSQLKADLKASTDDLKQQAREKHQRDLATSVASVERGAELTDSVQYRSNSAKKHLGEHVEALSEFVRIETQQPIEMVWATANLNKGGHFTPAARPPKPKRPKAKLRKLHYAGKIEEYDALNAEYRKRMGEYRDAELQPQIRVVKRAGATEDNHIVSLMHELGHAIDYDSDEEPSLEGFATKQAASGSTREGCPELREFFDYTHRSNSLVSHLGRSRQEWKDKGLTPPPFEEKKYLASAHEVWARAFSQWACGKTQGDVMFGQSERNHFFSEEEMEYISPMIENILDKRGLLK